MAPLADKSDLVRELEIFPGIDQDRYYQEFIEVGLFLSDKYAVVKALKGIEAKIEQRAREAWRGSADFRGRAAILGDRELAESLGLEFFRNHLKFSDMKKPCFKGVVSGALTSIEAEYGFLLSGSAFNPRTQYYLGAMDADAFRRQITEGRPPGKDPYVDPGHGEYTHRFQWCSIMSPTGLSWYPKTKTLAVYKAIGKYAAPPGAYAGFQWGLWDALCDRDNGTASVIPFKAAGKLLDFRCPNSLNTFIREYGEEHGLRFLQAFAIGRFAKRTAPTALQPWQYAAKKVFGSSDTGQLSEEEFTNLRRQISEAAYDPSRGWV